MKKVYLALLCTSITLMASAKIWRVNNNTGIVADFTNIQAANDAAAVHNGDTIHVEASASGYGGIYLNKRLVILGAGYYLTETSPMVANPQTEANPNISYFSFMYLNPGSKGSVISGIYINSYCIIQDSLVTVQHCYMNGDFYFGDNGTTLSAYADTIRQNLITGAFRAGSSSVGKYKNMLVYNNIIGGSSMDFSSNINRVDGYFINNDFVFYYSAGSQGNAVNITTANFVYQNNIWGYVNFGAYQTSNVYFNNICNGTGVPAGNSNQQNINASTAVYKDWTGNGAGFSSDGRFALKTGANPASNTGTINGVSVDCGAFGGPAPYILSGMPNMPSIYTLTVPTQINAGTASMNVTISSASH
ncbi:MAG: hypothetical protein ABJA78_17245 [Ferruginibacter sp.]